MRGFVQLSRTIFLAGGLLLGSSLATTPSRAATITYNFQGTVSFVGAQLNPPPTPLPFGTSGSSATMTGTMTVNTADTASGGVNGSYTIQGFQVTIGSYTANFGSSGGVVDIRNGNGNGNGADRFQVTADASGPGGSGNINFLGPRFFGINLRGPSNIFTSDALPNPAPSVSSFTNANQFRLQFGPEPGTPNARAVLGTLTSLTAVPLPASVILFGIGLVALIGLGAGGLRNIRLPQA